MSEEWQLECPPVDENLSPVEILRQAIEQFRPVRVFACFSSGNDSQISTHIAMQNGAHEVFNASTTIAIPEAREHFYRVCDSFQWPFRVKTPPEWKYRDMVLNEGFPGPGAHTYPYSWLKQRAIRELVRETKRQDGDTVMLVTGVRRKESTKRMGYVEPIVKQGATIWVAPIYNFSNADKLAYMEANNLVPSPVTEKIGISGECLCGAFARPGERRRLMKFYPEFESQIIQLEAEARSVKQPYCEWGNGRRVDPNQVPMFMPMCADCHSTGAEKESGI